MEYQKIINLLGNTPNQLSKFRAKNWVEVSDKSRGTYNVNSQIIFKTLMLMSSLCGYSDANILLSVTITVQNSSSAAEANDIKNVIIKNCASLTIA